MGRAFTYVILGGGTAAGYAAEEFVKRRISGGDVCIISEEKVAPYERPALSKGYLMPETAVRLPSFHTCIAAGQEAHSSKWYKQHGIELLLSTRVISVDVARKRLVTDQGETISYVTLVVATGARALRMEEFGVRGSGCGRICYLRNIADADHLLACISDVRREAELKKDEATGNATSSCNTVTDKDHEGSSIRNSVNSQSSGSDAQSLAGHIGADELVSSPSDCVSPPCSPRAVVIGGGYIGMEATATLVANGLAVTMVFPEAHCMARLFTPAIASFYESEYSRHGVSFIKGALIVAFEADPKTSNVCAVQLRDGRRLPADLVVVGIGIRPNTSLFESQLAIEAGGLRVNSHLQSVSSPSIYAIGDVAAFPLQPLPPFLSSSCSPSSSSVIRRVEHVEHARKSAAAAVTAILSPHSSPAYEYLPFFYSRVFNLSWQFYGHNVGQCVLFGLSDFPAEGAVHTASATDPQCTGVSVAEQRDGGRTPKPVAARLQGQAWQGVDEKVKGDVKKDRTRKFGAFWVDNGRVVGVFLEGGTKEEYAAAAAVARDCPRVSGSLTDLASKGTMYLLATAESLKTKQNSNWGTLWPNGNNKHPSSIPPHSGSQKCDATGDTEVATPGMMHATVGVAAAVAIIALAYWHGHKLRKKW